MRIPMTTRKPDKLSTERLRLCPLGPEDGARFFPVLKDPDLYTCIPEEPPVSWQALRQKLMRYCAGPPPSVLEEWFNWGVFCAKRPIGTLQATIHVPMGSAEIAYLLGTAFRKCGLASEAVFAMTEWLFIRCAVKLRRSGRRYQARGAPPADPAK